MSAAVETLREAARRMRERAEAATPGPWSSFFSVVRRSDGRDLFLTTKAGGYGDAPHAASWHPAVALAVADWLEACAGSAETSGLMPDVYGYRVARAYLGES